MKTTVGFAMQNKWRLLSCDLARSRHEHDLALLESLRGSWRSRSGLSDGACAVRAVGVASDREREPVVVSFCQSPMRSDHRSQYQRAVLHTFLRRSARSSLSHSTMFYMRVHLRRFGFRLRLHKGLQNTHMVAER